MADDAGRPSEAAPRKSNRAASLLVAAGILLSRVLGLVRERMLAVYFGTGLQADVFSAGLRMPNVLQNLLGEGTLSASFIPVYSELLGQGRTREAGRVAGAVFALLLGIAGAIALLGVVLAPLLVTVFTPGFEGHRRDLMITVVRVVFPMTGVLVLSAWALGILNSHRKFFIPYFAPVLWNVAIIVALIAFAGRVDLDGLLMAAVWGALVGGFLQFGIQLPWVLKLDREIRLNSGRKEPAFKEVVRNAVPAIMGRGVVQVSTYVDMVLGSLLAIGAVARLRYAQALYVLPISLFGMSIAAAELPDLARDRAQGAAALRERTIAAATRVAFFVVPSFVAFVMLGEVFVAGIYRAGEFGVADVRIVWLTLAAYSVGLLASTSGRIYQTAFYALRDTKTPARVAGLRVLTSAIAGAALMLQFEPVTLGGVTVAAGLFGDLRIEGLPLGPVGLALGAAVGAWLEWGLLRRSLSRQIGSIGVGAGALGRLFAAAIAAAVAGYGTSLVLQDLYPLIAAGIVASVFGVVYLALARLLGVTEARVVTDGVLRRVRRRRT
jgi:putative peptidoglycan lipid II flippase